MAQPTFVPITEADQVRPARRLAVPKHWVADRPADLSGPTRPTGARYGTPGPDQGFALSLARRFEDRLHLRSGEHHDDVVIGAALLASKRGGLLGRAPCIYDLEAAFALFGFLVEAPPEELVSARRALFASVSHDYVTRTRPRGRGARRHASLAGGPADGTARRVAEPASAHPGLGRAAGARLTSPPLAALNRSSRP